MANKNIDDDTRKRAKAFVEKSEEYRSDPYSAMTKKERVVSKKELEESGLSLRDFLNKERGLTRREGKADSKVEAAKKVLKLGEKVSAEEVEKAKKQLNLAKGGYVNCGASVPPTQKAKK